MASLSDLRMYIVKNGTTSAYMVNPYSVPDEDMPGFYREGKSRFKCACGFLYEFRHGDNALIPVSRKAVSGHSDSCPLSERYSHNEHGIVFDPSKGRLVAAVSGDISRRPERSARNEEMARKNIKGEHSSLSPYGLIKRINLLALYYEYEKKRSSVLNGDTEHYYKYYLTEKFSRFVFSSARTVDIDGYDSVICGTSLEKDGYDFFYRPVRGLEVSYTDRGGKKHKDLYEHRFSLEDFYQISRDAGVDSPETRNTDTGAVFLRLMFPDREILPIKVSFPALKSALMHLNASFTAREVDFFSDSVIAAGWRYPDRDKDGNIKRNAAGKIFPIADRLSLFNVNRYGVFTESMAECRLSELIIKKANKSPSIMYYKPFVLTDEFYGGRWLPKGVIRAGKAEKAVVVEIFSSTRSNEYMDKIRYQEPDKYTYLTWFPTQEPLELFSGQIDSAVDRLLNG